MRRVGRVKMYGFEKVERNLQYALSGLKNNSTEGLIDVARDIHRDANKTSPVIPRNTGDLIRSRFIVDNKGRVPWGLKARFVGERKRSGGWKNRRSPAEMQADHTRVIQKYRARAAAKKHPFVTLGYSAWYGVYPHEMGGISPGAEAAAGGRTSVRTGASVGWSRPGSGPKFFQTALYRKAKNLQGEVYEEANLHGNQPPKIYVLKSRI